MLATQFFDSTANSKFQKTGNRKSGFVYPGSSGSYSKKGWTFNSTPTLYHMDPTGWYISEKRDGLRATWIPGKGLLSRRGHVYATPTWFNELMPTKCWLDGELYAGRENWPTLLSIAKRKVPRDQEWQNITFEVFDVPFPVLQQKPFLDRYIVLDHLVRVCNNKWDTIRQEYTDFTLFHLPDESPLVLVQQTKVLSMVHAYKLYVGWLKNGGEGAVLRSNSPYETKQSKTMLKWKPVPTAEARITGFNPRKTGSKGGLGTFHVELLDQHGLTGIRFNLSGRMSHLFRQQYKFNRTGTLIGSPKKGGQYPVLNDIVIFKFMRFNPSGRPRQPVYIGLRHKKDI